MQWFLLTSHTGKQSRPPICTWAPLDWRTSLKTLKQRFSACNWFKSCRGSSSITLYVYVSVQNVWWPARAKSCFGEGTSELRILWARALKFSMLWHKHKLKCTQPYSFTSDALLRNASSFTECVNASSGMRQEHKLWIERIERKEKKQRANIKTSQFWPTPTERVGVPLVSFRIERTFMCFSTWMWMKFH